MFKVPDTKIQQQYSQIQEGDTEKYNLVYIGEFSWQISKPLVWDGPLCYLCRDQYTLLVSRKYLFSRAEQICVNAQEVVLSIFLEVGRTSGKIV